MKIQSILFTSARFESPEAPLSDFWVIDGCIQRQTDGHQQVDRKIDLKGAVIFPGLTDIHVHFRQPGLEAAETIASGARAAAHGGFTRVVTMPNTFPAVDTPLRIREQLAWAEQSDVTLYPCGALTLGRAGQELTDFQALAQAGACTLSDDGTTPRSMELMLEAGKQAAALDLPIMDHAENPALKPQGVMHQSEKADAYALPGIPRDAEISIVERDIAISRQTGCHMHIQHMSCAESVALLAEARKEGLPVTGEATPHHLALCIDDIDPANTSYKMNPPLRDAADRDALRDGVANGTITILATDHAPHTSEAKAEGFLKAPFGIIGLEWAFPVTYTLLVASGRMPLSQFMACWTTSPSQLIRRAAPTLLDGMPACFTAIDLAGTTHITAASLCSQSCNTPFLDTTWKSRILCTMNNGRITYAQN